MASNCTLKDGPALYTECIECEERSRCKSEAADVENTKILRIIIAGTRTFHDYDKLRHVMSEIAGNIPKDNIEIVSGGCSGADRLAEVFARRNGISLKVFRADWKKYGRAAGPIRNRDMAEYVGATGFLVAFWDGKSRGTKHMIETGTERGLWVRVVMVS